MATPLTDGINALTRYANETTGKQDTTLSDAVGSLVEGYGGGNKLVLSMNNIKSMVDAFRSSVFPENGEIEIFLSSCTAGSFMFYGARNLKKISLHFNESSPTIKSLNMAMFNNYTCESLTITGDLSGVTNYQNMLNYLDNTTQLDCVFDFTSCTTDNSVLINGNSSVPNNVLTDMRFVPNTLKRNFSLKPYSALNDDTLVSVANCLRADASGMALSLHSDVTPKLDTVLGVDDNGTFIKDASGTLTLTNFITTVKGWTIS